MKILGKRNNGLSIIMEGNVGKVMKAGKLIERVQFEEGDNLVEAVNKLKKEHLLEALNNEERRLLDPAVAIKEYNVANFTKRLRYGMRVDKDPEALTRYGFLASAEVKTEDGKLDFYMYPSDAGRIFVTVNLRGETNPPREYMTCEFWSTDDMNSAINKALDSEVYFKDWDIAGENRTGARWKFRYRKDLNNRIF